MSVQCRTMLSQRPCGNSQCTREECSGKAPNMCDSCGISQGSREWCEYCGLDTTPPREPLSAPESDERTTGEGEPLYTLQGLSESDIRTLMHALMFYRDHAELSQSDRVQTDTLRGRITDMWIMSK